ncbi:MAG TPA: DUF4386 domain-containing protein [Rubrobacter sp.]|nr:DUF4386 domain-containing protein [Rubrobacter sp.]
MDTGRKLAIAAGVCYLITHVTSVPAAFLYGPILNRAGYVLGSVPDTRVLLGAFLEVICALAIVGTAVALFPVVKRHNEGVALGYVGLRTLEAGIIAVGVVPLLAVVTLRQDMTGTAGADTAAVLVEFHNWTRLLGPGLVCGVNTVLMAYLMYRSRLVPRFIPVLGLIGGPLVFAYHTAQMFGASEQILSWAAIGVIPIFAWEVTLAFRLIAKGFNPSAAIPSEPDKTDSREIGKKSLATA